MPDLNLFLARARVETQFVLIVGKEELRMKRFKLRDMKKNEQKDYSLDAIVSMFKSS